MSTSILGASLLIVIVASGSSIPVPMVGFTDSVHAIHQMELSHREAAMARSVPENYPGYFVDDGDAGPACKTCGILTFASGNPVNPASQPVVHVSVEGAIVPGTMGLGQCGQPEPCSVRNCTGSFEVTVTNGTGYNLTFQQAPNGFPVPRQLGPGVPPPAGVIQYNVDRACDQKTAYVLTFSGRLPPDGNAFTATFTYNVGCDVCK